MANKTVVTIDYESGPNSVVEVASDGTLTEDANLQQMVVTQKVVFLRLVKLLDTFLRNHDILEIRFKEEVE